MLHAWPPPSPLTNNDHHVRPPRPSDRSTSASMSNAIRSLVEQFSNQAISAQQQAASTKILSRSPASAPQLPTLVLNDGTVPMRGDGDLGIVLNAGRIGDTPRPRSATEPTFLIPPTSQTHAGQAVHTAPAAESPTSLTPRLPTTLHPPSTTAEPTATRRNSRSLTPQNWYTTSGTPGYKGHRRVSGHGHGHGKHHGRRERPQEEETLNPFQLLERSGAVRRRRGRACVRDTDVTWGVGGRHRKGDDAQMQTQTQTQQALVVSPKPSSPPSIPIRVRSLIETIEERTGGFKRSNSTVRLEDAREVHAGVEGDSVAEGLNEAMDVPSLPPLPHPPLGSASSSCANLTHITAPPTHSTSTDPPATSSMQSSHTTTNGTHGISEPATNSTTPTIPFATLLRHWRTIDGGHGVDVSHEQRPVTEHDHGFTGKSSNLPNSHRARYIRTNICCDLFSDQPPTHGNQPQHHPRAQPALSGLQVDVFVQGCA
ncbi:uncharacterized protein EV422DRAFT_548297 [Fimicolochytrium jonesii]|uniref:uncharacterized protein n=1 Tax=Fimicolochytrium jonesii TaxID=1396493 RepID=UPI0022FE0EB4|nr:uncharacterized protein EV422DRAFT_548297 [Fimicolochytrium jonesii]KAI8815762.1 hypothetical protein EV422DRAFT_548297 [Fimicolochytrium jonesii]